MKSAWGIAAALVLAGAVAAPANAADPVKIGVMYPLTGNAASAGQSAKDATNLTAPEKIQAALKATDLKPGQLMIGYNGVKFDDTGQNVLASTFLIQLKGKEYVSVWPQARATSALEWPMKGWR
jgi:hypothetical protein